MMQIQKVPLLRFFTFDTNWKTYVLQNLCEHISYGLTVRPEYLVNGIPLISAREIVTGKINYESAPLISVEDFDKLSDKAKPKYGDIFLSKTGSIGFAAPHDKDIKIAITQNIATIRILNSIMFSSSFLLQYFKTPLFQKRAITLVNKSTIMDLQLGDIRKLLIPAPSSLPEQQKIADFLTSVDQKIQALTRNVELLKDYKKGVMQKVFKQEIRFRDDDGGEFPDWEEKKLGLLTTKTGKKNKENLKLPIYSINNKEGFLPQSDQFEGMDSNDRGYDITLYKIIKAKTFAYNPARINVGSIGYSHDLNDVIISSLYVCFQTKNSLDDLYLLAYLDSYNFNKAVLRNVEGGVRQYLFYDNFSSIKIPLPSLEEQTKIANFLTSIDDKISAVEGKLEKMKEWKKGLLQKMFV